MSFEPDTNDIRIRQLKEEIAKIREEQFARSFPTNAGGSPSIINSDSGIPPPTIGVSSVIPVVIRITKDTGVIDLLNFDGQPVDKPFVVGEIITGNGGGATATVADVDQTTTTSGTLTLVPGSIIGTFIDNEDIDGNINGKAEADGTQFTQTGRGHLNAGAGSIIAESTSPPAEIHFIDNAQQDGQTVYLRAQDGQTIRLRRPITSDGTTGNLDIDQSFNIIENALIFIQYQVASNATPTGGWVPLLSDVTTVTGAGGTTFPILYPKQDLGTTSGVIDLGLTQSDGHYKQITLNGDASLTFSNLPPSINGFKFYVLTIQDGVGGHVYTGLPSSVINAGTLLGQLQTSAGAQTLWQFSTADGGVSWHAQVINPQGSVGQPQTPWLSPIDADRFDLFNASKIIFFQGGGFSFPTDASIQGISGSGQGLQVNVPSGQSNRWFNEGKLFMELLRTTPTSHRLVLFDEGLIDRTAGITFSHLAGPPALSSILPVGLELQYSSGQGSGQGGFHGFRVGAPLFPQFEIREDVVRVNVNLDMITNDIINADQIQFDPFGGFVPTINHGERRITGGAEGIDVNLPFTTTPPDGLAFNIYFENSAQTTSDLQYSFTKNNLFLGDGTCTGAPSIRGALGYVLCRGGGLFDLGNRVLLTSSADSTSPPDPQTLELEVANDLKVIFTNLEDGPAGSGGGMKMFTDLNMQTFNINNIDVAVFEPDVGTGIGGLPNGVYGIVADTTGTLGLFASKPTFLFHIPPGPTVPTSPQFGWAKFHQIIATMDEFEFHMRANGGTDRPLVTSDGGFSYGVSHLPAFNPAFDGESRLINNAGSLDVVFRTGGQLVNLSDLTAVTSLDIDNDLGTVGAEGVEINWNVSNFHRMILDGDITITMNGLPAPGEWQEITVEFLQNNTGGHAVTFLDTFQNSITPTINQGTNRYTTVKFYSYNDGFERILAFDIIGQNSLDFAFFQGIIQARMASDQTLNTAVGNHLEFDTALFSDKIIVSSTGGQGSGVFSGFIAGRTYECECAFAVKNSGINAPATMAVQFFDRTSSQLIGTIGVATDVQIIDRFQQIAKAYFVPASDTDTLEVQIVSNNLQADVVHSGIPTSTNLQPPMSYVTIKDCGVSEGRFNEIINEDLPQSEIPPDPPLIGFNARGLYYHIFQDVRYGSVSFSSLAINGELICGFQGRNELKSPQIPPNDAVFIDGKFMAVTPGKLRRVRFLVDKNTLNKDFTVTLMEDDVAINTLFTVIGGVADQYVFPPTGAGAIPLKFGKRYWYRFLTTDGINPSSSSRLSGSLATEIYWGSAG